MLGDKIVVKQHHRQAAEDIYQILHKEIEKRKDRVSITVAGESGSGKSEIATEIGRLLKEKDDLKCALFHQDDYFIRPPGTNTEYRKKGLDNVGMHEVRLDLMDEHLKIAKNPPADSDRVLEKPLIDYDADKILSEKIDLSGLDVIICEGTYTTSLKNADYRVFIDRTYRETKKHRQERARDKLDSYADKILEKEHKIISAHKKDAYIIVSGEYRAFKASD